MRLADLKERHFSLPFHVVRKLDTSKKMVLFTKLIGVLVAFLLAGVICTILKPGTFGTFYQQMFLGCFNPNDNEKFMEFLMCISLLLLVAFALAPAFKMKFWNIGGEGQILVGVLVTAGISRFMGNAGVNNIVILLVAFVASIAAGVLWGVIPAIFKAFFGTNETLFTLMMNYVAAGLIALMINVWVPSGSQVFGDITTGIIPDLFGVKFLTSIILTAIIVSIMIVYMKLTKHGYEIAVVGESANTARYIGINVKAVTIRTMCVSGAICGIVGFLLVAGYHHTLTSILSDGRGFTGVLIAWLGGFEPISMIAYSFLVAVFQRGSINAASFVGMSTSNFSAIVTGMFFLVIIASTFFVNYRIMLKPRANKPNNELATAGSWVGGEATLETPTTIEAQLEEAPVEEPEAEVKDEPVAPKKKTSAKKATSVKKPGTKKTTSSKSKKEAK